MTKENNKDKFIQRRLKSKQYYAKHKNLEFNIDHDYLVSIQTDRCPISGLRLDWSDPHWKKKNVPILVRIDHHKGFVEGNLEWIAREVHMRRLGFHYRKKSIHQL